MIPTIKYNEQITVGGLSYTVVYTAINGVIASADDITVACQWLSQGKAVLLGITEYDGITDYHIEAVYHVNVKIKGVL
jgi:hypothetical protein